MQVCTFPKRDIKKPLTTMHTSPKNTAPSTSSVFLASGGARGITAQCAIRMAHAFHCGFILLGRTAIAEPEPAWAAACHTEAELKKQRVADCRAKGRAPILKEIQAECRHILARREIEHTLQTIKRAGGRAMYVCADVTDGQGLPKKLTDPIRQMGPITGLIHGAGALADKRIEGKTAQDFETVYQTKVTGLMNLLSCLDLDRLDHLILFSSAAGFYGNIGQTDYALANETLNKIAYRIKRRYPSCDVCAFNWGPWDGGMVTPELKELFAARQIPLIPVETGTQILVQRLQSGGPVQVVVGSVLSPASHDRPVAKSHRIHRCLTLDANPFLKHHVIGGTAVLPIVCAISWMARACEQCYTGFKFFQCRNFRVLKGILFNQTLAAGYVLDIKEIPEADAGDIVLDADIWSQSQAGKIQHHYRAQIALRETLPEPTVIPFNAAALRTKEDAAPYYRNGTLFHGPTFQGVRHILELSADGLVMACELPGIGERDQGQFPVHAFNPYAADVQLQSAGIWARLMCGAASLPLSQRMGEQFAPVPFDTPFYVSLQIAKTTETQVVANIATHDAWGRIYSRVWGAEATLSKRLNPLFLQNRLAAEQP